MKRHKLLRDMVTEDISSDAIKQLAEQEIIIPENEIQSEFEFMAEIRMLPINMIAALKYSYTYGNPAVEERQTFFEF